MVFGQTGYAQGEDGDGGDRHQTPPVKHMLAAVYRTRLLT